MRQFVSDPLIPDPFAEFDGRVILGGESFVHERTANLDPVPEVPRSHWQPQRPELSALFAEHGAMAIATAYRRYGYTLAEVADHLGVNFATVSRRLRRLEPRRIA